MWPAKFLKWIGVLLMGITPLLNTAFPVWAAPANDDFVHAVVIPGIPFSGTVDASAATTELDEPQDCYWAERTVWYKFVSTADMVVNVALPEGEHGEANLTLYEAMSHGFGGLSYMACTYYDGNFVFQAKAGTIYYFQIATTESVAGDLHLNLTLAPPPANDNFADAVLVDFLGFSQTVNMTTATLEADEPMPSCAEAKGTIWYTFRSPIDQLVSAYTHSWSMKPFAIYVGDSLTTLTEIVCPQWRDVATFYATANTTYYIQIINSEGGGPVEFQLETAPALQADFYVNPYAPSIYDTIYFESNSYDPGGADIATCTWLWNGRSPTTGCSAERVYTKDGTYTVQLDIATADGRTASATQLVAVKTHDIAITKFSRPSSAKVGRTYKLIVGINNKRYPEQVQVELSKGTPQGYEYLGSLTKSVPVRSGSRTTEFTFTYTFTAEDARIGKVTFRAAAMLLNNRDALPSDNEFISFPIKVTGKAGKNSVALAVVLAEFDGYITDVTSNLLGLDAEIPVITPPEPAAANYQLFIPLVSKAE